MTDERERRCAGCDAPLRMFRLNYCEKCSEEPAPQRAPILPSRIHEPESRISEGAPESAPREWFIDVNEWLDGRKRCMSGMAFSQGWLDEMEMTSYKMIPVIEKSAYDALKAKLADYESGDVPTWREEYWDMKAVAEKLDEEIEKLKAELAEAEKHIDIGIGHIGELAEARDEARAEVERLKSQNTYQLFMESVDREADLREQSERYSDALFRISTMRAHESLAQEMKRIAREALRADEEGE